MVHESVSRCTAKVVCPRKVGLFGWSQVGWLSGSLGCQSSHQLLGGLISMTSPRVQCRRETVSNNESDEPHFWCTKPRGLGFPYSENAMARVAERMVCVGVTWNQHPSGSARACLARSQFLRRSLDHFFPNRRLFQFREVQALSGFLTRRCRDFLVQYLILVLQRDSHVFHFSCRFVGVWADTNEQDKTKRSNTDLSAQSSAIFCR